MVDSLAQAVAQNRTALMALTALKNYDNYTFTHMVNVSILTMGQARGLGIDGALLREFGLAALMHDIGKVKTPSEILNKPDKLTDKEFDILKRHTVEGAEILRQHAGDPDARAGRGLRAPPARRRHRVSRQRHAGRTLNLGTCCAASRTSTTRCARSASTRRRSRPIASWRCCSATTARSSIRTWFAASRSSSASIRPATSCGSTPERSRS